MHWRFRQDRSVKTGSHAQIPTQTSGYEYETGHVFVTGYSLVSGPSGDEQRQTRTYEFDIDIEQYRPKLSWMDTYEGQARTEASS